MLILSNNCLIRFMFLTPGEDSTPEFISRHHGLISIALSTFSQLIPPERIILISKSFTLFITVSYTHLRAHETT